jgi:hypothetical protein
MARKINATLPTCATAGALTDIVERHNKLNEPFPPRLVPRVLIGPPQCLAVGVVRWQLAPAARARVVLLEPRFDAAWGKSVVGGWWVVSALRGGLGGHEVRARQLSNQVACSRTFDAALAEEVATGHTKHRGPRLVLILGCEVRLRLGFGRTSTGVQAQVRGWRLDRRLVLRVAAGSLAG